MNGAKGRMGQAIIACAALDPEVRISAQVDEGDDLARALAQADAVIDFSHHTVTAPVAAACAAAGKRLVIGTTGHTDAELAQIRAAAESIPLVFAPNYSVGVNTLFWLTQKAAEILGPDFDLEVRGNASSPQEGRAQRHRQAPGRDPRGSARPAICAGCAARPRGHRRRAHRAGDRHARHPRRRRRGRSHRHFRRRQGSAWN